MLLLGATTSAKRKSVLFNGGFYKENKITNWVVLDPFLGGGTSLVESTKLGANFSVPGSGKTTVILTVYEKLRLEGKVNTLFIVGPPSCFGPWRHEFLKTFNRPPAYTILAGGEPEQRKSEYFNFSESRSELYLTSYQTLLNDQNEVNKFIKQKEISVFLVIDEAHYIKQIGGSWAGAVLSLAQNATYRCILTGTPFPKSYTDVFNIFDFLYLDKSPLDSEIKIKIENNEKIERGSNNIKEILSNKINPYFYRVRKSDLGLIPPLFHPPRVLKMNRYEQIVYDAINKKIKDYSRNDYLKNIDVVKRLCRGRMIRLRQTASYVKLMAESIAEYNEEYFEDGSELKEIIYKYDELESPAKLIHLVDLVTLFQKRKQKVVIWAHFIGSLKLIKKSLMDKGIYSELIYGNTPTESTSLKEEETREYIRDKFVCKDSGLDILVANPAACAESISLHENCFHAIYYDLSYNCAQYIQSLDRIHRVGGSENNQANYYFLQYANTIDQDIMENLNRKSERMFQVIDQEFAINSMDMFEEQLEDEVAAYQRLFKTQND